VRRLPSGSPARGDRRRPGQGAGCIRGAELGGPPARDLVERVAAVPACHDGRSACAYSLRPEDSASRQRGIPAKLHRHSSV
jgi:hypothetical protein